MRSQNENGLAESFRMNQEMEKIKPIFVCMKWQKYNHKAWSHKTTLTFLQGYTAYTPSQVQSFTMCLTAALFTIYTIQMSLQQY